MMKDNVLSPVAGAADVLLAVDESGMSTVEYAIGTIAAAAFGAILYTVVTGRLDRERADQHHHAGVEHQRLTAG